MRRESGLAGGRSESSMSSTSVLLAPTPMQPSPCCWHRYADASINSASAKLLQEVRVDHIAYRYMSASQLDGFANCASLCESIGACGAYSFRDASVKWQAWHDNRVSVDGQNGCRLYDIGSSAAGKLLTAPLLVRALGFESAQCLRRSAARSCPTQWRGAPSARSGANYTPGSLQPRKELSQRWMRDVVQPTRVELDDSSYLQDSQHWQRPLRTWRQTPPVIGIVGGSISAGMGSGWVPPGKSYGEVLAGLMRATVYNRAIAATGSALPSYCLDALLPQRVDVLLIETAPNDSGGGTESTGDGRRVDPLASLERLLRRLRLERPKTVPVILYVCVPPHMVPRSLRSFQKCEGLYSAVARRYGVAEVSLRAFVRARPDFATRARRGGAPARSDKAASDPLEKLFAWHYVHPDEEGHKLTAQMLAVELPRILESVAATAVEQQISRKVTPWWSTLSRDPRPSVRMLPRPLHRDAVAEDDDAPWQCRMCDWIGCQSLLPVAGSASGFTMRSGGGVNVHDGQVAKFGWLSSGPGDRVSFDVHGGSVGARVHLAMVCSHSNVGNATVSVHRNAVRGTEVGVGGDDGGGGGGHGGNISYVLVTSKRVQARWRQRTTQQCIVPLGRIGPGQHTLTIQVDAPLTDPLALVGDKVEIKVFGIYVQQLLWSSTQKRRRD